MKRVVTKAQNRNPQLLYLTFLARGSKNETIINSMFVFVTNF